MSVEAQAMIVARILLAAVLGGLIGLQREYRGNPAGVRTLALVALGSSLFAQESPLFSQGDSARVAAQIVSGIGFLGAGVIVRDGATVHGITTAATIWATASIGVAVGTGLLIVAIATALLTLTLLELSPITKGFGEHRPGNPGAARAEGSAEQTPPT